MTARLRLFASGFKCRWRQRRHPNAGLPLASIGKDRGFHAVERIDALKYCPFVHCDASGKR